MALQPWQKGKIIGIEQLNENTRHFRIQASGLSYWQPGQFVTLDLPIHEKPNKRLRSYSIAGIDREKNIFELCIETNHKGSGSLYIFAAFIVGCEITFRGPAGVFTLPSIIDCDTFYISEQTGVVPFRSWIHNTSPEINSGKLYLIYGAEEISGLLYHKEFVNAASAIPELCYIPVIKPETVQQKLINLLGSKKQPSGLSLPQAEFYICGWKEMVDSVKDILIAYGYDRKAINSEVFG